MTNLEKRDSIITQAFSIISKVDAASEAGNFEEAKFLNFLFDTLMENAIEWEQKHFNS